MKIHRLTLQNFRCFAEKTLDFAPQFNVLIGDNGSGKSAILDALAIGLQEFLSGIDEREFIFRRFISIDDVRRMDAYQLDIPTTEKVFPVRMRMNITIDSAQIEWRSNLYHEKSEVGNKREIWNAARKLRNTMVIEGAKMNLPLMGYYGTGRVSHRRIKTNTDIEEIPSAEIDTIAPGSRLEGYHNCIDNEIDRLFLDQWLKTYELSVLQRLTRNNTLDSIKRVIGKCMENWTEIEYDVLLKELVAKNDHGRRIPTRLLSDGQRNILYMVLDIAYRAVTLNPHLGAQACALTPGVVLIDEIDLHLHPNWQRRVVNDLRTVFPQIQFIATTHAPLIIQSLQEGELIDLNDGSTGDYVGRSPEDILEQEMNVELPQRSQRSLDMIAAAEEYYRVLEQAKTTKNGNLESLKRRLDELTEPFADNEAYIAFLRSERLAAGVGD